MTPRDTDDAFSVGTWQAYPNENRLVQGDRVVSLEPRVMSVLVCLAGAPGKIVSADDLINTAWHGRPHGDHTVYQAIADLRKALGDDSRRPKFIETIPKRGYRLICPIGWIHGDANAQRWTDIAGTSQRWSWQQVSVFAGLSAIVLAAATTFLASNSNLLDQLLPNTDEPDKPSIAVMPFASGHASEDDRLLAVGISEEILRLLSSQPGVQVTSRYSSFAAARQTENIQEIGQTLDVDSVLRGSVTRSNNRLHISASLVDTVNGTSLWSRTYDREQDEIFLIQAEVARAIYDSLRVQLSGDVNWRNPTNNIDAYAAFLKAKVLYTEGRLFQAEELLLEAVSLDPKFGEAFELLAATYWRLGGESIPADEGQIHMAAAASRAVQINPDLVFAKALFQIGNTRKYSLLAELEALEEALSQQSSNTDISNAITWNLMVLGYHEEALSIAERAVAEDPLSIVANTRLADAFYATGSPNKALTALKFVSQLTQENWGWEQAAIHIANGEYDAAVVHLRSFLGLIDEFGEIDAQEFMTKAIDPASGPSFLENYIQRVIAAAPENDTYFLETSMNHLFLYFGHIDMYYEKLLALESNDTGWSDAESMFQLGSIFRRTGFTQHPEYLPLATRLGVTNAWDVRGPPDFCSKSAGIWVCE